MAWFTMMCEIYQKRIWLTYVNCIKLLDIKGKLWKSSTFFSRKSWFHQFYPCLAGGFPWGPGPEGRLWSCIRCKAVFFGPERYVKRNPSDLGQFCGCFSVGFLYRLVWFCIVYMLFWSFLLIQNTMLGVLPLAGSFMWGELQMVNSTWNKCFGVFRHLQSFCFGPENNGPTLVCYIHTRECLSSLEPPAKPEAFASCHHKNAGGRVTGWLYHHSPPVASPGHFGRAAVRTNRRRRGQRLFPLFHWCFEVKLAMVQVQPRARHVTLSVSPGQITPNIETSKTSICFFPGNSETSNFNVWSYSLNWICSWATRPESPTSPKVKGRQSGSRIQRDGTATRIDKALLSGKEKLDRMGNREVWGLVDCMCYNLWYYFAK